MQYLWATQRVSFVNVPFVVFSLSGYQKQTDKKKNTKKNPSTCGRLHTAMTFLLVFLLLLFIFALASLGGGKTASVSYGWSGYIQHTVSVKRKKKEIDNKNNVCFFSLIFFISVSLMRYWSTQATGFCTTLICQLLEIKTENLLPHIP